MKIIVLMSFLLLSGIPYLSAQSLEVAGGINRNIFFDYKKQMGHFNSEYNPDFGYSFELSIDKHLKQNNTNFRASLLIDNYKGTFMTSDGGLGGSDTTNGEVRKTTVGIGLYPFVFSVVNNLEMNLGGEISFKISDCTTGYKSSWRLGQAGSQVSLDSVSVHNNVIAGFSGRVRYDFRLNDKLFINPFYKFYLGLTNEFKNTEANIKSMRHSIGIGIIRKID